MSERKNRVKPVLILLLVLLIATVAAGAGLQVRKGMREKTYTETVAGAEKYLAAENYEDAVVVYRQAIELDPEQEDAYLKLADVYLKQDDVSGAVAVLREGAGRIRSPRITLMLSRLTGRAGAEREDKTKNLAAGMNPEEIEQASANVAWNISFLQMLETFTYDDYRDEFGAAGRIAEDEEGYLEVEHKNFDGVCYYRDTEDGRAVIDAGRGTPAGEGMPQKVTLHSLGLLFRNFEGAVSLSRLRSMTGTQLEPETADGRTVVEFEYRDVLMRFETDADGNIVSPDAWNELVPLNANQEQKEPGHLTGVVVAATTGNGIGGAVVTFLPAGSGQDEISATTDASGGFAADLSPGEYTVRVTADGYITEEFPFTAEEGKTYGGESFVLSPNLTNGTARIVLEWNATPRDLDSYLTGSSDSGVTVNTNYRQQHAVSGGETFAELDLDDTDGYGPETTTIYDLNGVYTFSVNDFLSTGTMAAQGAVVKVYLPGQDPVTITLPAGSGVVNDWEVCVIDHGRLEIINAAP